jgi:ATP-dependent RNA helicase TDRD9
VLEDEGVPEILRCPLEQLVLQTKLFGMGEPKALLALSLDPPDLTNLESTILLLKEVSLLLAAANKLI